MKTFQFIKFSPSIKSWRESGSVKSSEIDEEDIIEWIGKIISGNTFAIEFFNNDQRRFGSEIDTEELQGLTYKKLEQFTGYYGLTKLLDVVDSFKIRCWDGKNNFDYTMICEENGNVVINQIFVGIL